MPPTTPAMSRSIKVLDFIGVDAEFALYETDHGDPQSTRTKILLPLVEYANFGRPEQITVTIVPGSHISD